MPERGRRSVMRAVPAAPVRTQRLAARTTAPGTRRPACVARNRTRVRCPSASATGRALNRSPAPRRRGCEVQQDVALPRERPDDPVQDPAQRVEDVETLGLEFRGPLDLQPADTVARSIELTSNPAGPLLRSAGGRRRRQPR